MSITSDLKDCVVSIFTKAIDGNTVPMIILALIAWWVCNFSITGAAGNVISAIVGALSTYLTKELNKAREGATP